MGDEAAERVAPRLVLLGRWMVRRVGLRLVLLGRWMVRRVGLRLVLPDRWKVGPVGSRVAAPGRLSVRRVVSRAGPLGVRGRVGLDLSLGSAEVQGYDTRDDQADAGHLDDGDRFAEEGGADRDDGGRT
jgi:hypothetical protein